MITLSTLPEEDVSLSELVMKRILQSKYRWFTTRCKPIIIYISYQNTSLLLAALAPAVFFMQLIQIFNCRQVREDGKDKNSVVSFTLTDEPRHIDLVASNRKEEVGKVP